LVSFDRPRVPQSRQFDLAVTHLYDPQIFAD